MNRIVRWWKYKQRNIDLKTLWPICMEQGGTPERAALAFGVHISIDPAWNVPIAELSDAQYRIWLLCLEHFTKEEKHGR